MIELIREIGIFIVIAQAVLYFVPGETYAKYVKVIIGILMIAKTMQPVLAFATGDEWEEILERPIDFAQTQEFETGEFKAGSNEETILAEIEKELKNRLNENPAEGYLVEAVSVKENSRGDMEGITITVLRPEDRRGKEIKINKVTVDETETYLTDSAKQEQDRLKEYYGNLLALPASQIEITGL